MNTTASVQRQTLYLAVIAALIVGFLGGVLYSSFRTPSGGQEITQQQETARAIAGLEQATRDRPSDSQVWAALGHAYFDTNQPSKAIAAYTKALELNPKDPNVMTDLGVMYHQDNQHRKAIELFDQVLSMDSRHQQARFNKGVVLYAGLNDLEGALDEWRTLVRDHPEATAPSGKPVRTMIVEIEKEKSKKQ